MKPPKSFYQSIGVCITAWANIESTLFNIFRETVNCDLQLAAIIFYRTPTLDSRIKLTDEIVISSLPKPERKNGGHSHPLSIEWGKLCRDLSVLLPVRNAIAHNPVVISNETTTDKSGKKVHSTTYVQITRSVGEHIRGRPNKISHLRKTDLDAHKAEVDAMFARMYDFNWKLKELFAAQRQQAKEQTLETSGLVQALLRARSHPPQS